jgi:NADH-ubiquinone oxidoreductase chain 2
MLLLSLIFLSLANAVTKRREMFIFNRVAMIILLYSSIVGYDSLAVISLGSGISIYSGLFHLVFKTIQSLEIPICLVCVILIQLTSFYPRKINLGLEYLN